MAYSYQQLGDFLDQLRGSGNEAAAFAMYNGLSGIGSASNALGGNAGNFDSYLRSRWGDDTLKRWVNENDNKYGSGTLFDPTTGTWEGIGQASGQKGTIAGWDPKQFQAAGMGVYQQGYTPKGYGSGANGFAGSTGQGLQSNGQPMPEGVGSTAWMYGQPGLANGAVPGGAPGAGGAPSAWGGGAPGGGYPGGGGGAPSAGAANVGTPWDYFNDEGYKFAKDQGMEGIQNSAAAGGGLNSGNTLKSLAKFNSGLASQYYGDAFDRWANQRNFGESQFQDRRNFGESQFQDRRNFGEGVRRYNQGFDEDQRRNNRDFDWRAFVDDRNYGTGLDQWNRSFDYNAANNDRNWLSQTLGQLSNQGLAGAQGNSSLAALLAQLFGQNTMAGAGAGAAGGVGGATNTNNFLSQLMQYLQQQQLVNSLRNP